MLASPWSAASLYFSDCSQKHIFPWCYFRTLERARERHGFIRRVLLEPLRVMHDGFSFFRTMIRQIEAICYRSATNGSFYPALNLLFWFSRFLFFRLFLLLVQFFQVFNCQLWSHGVEHQIIGVHGLCRSLRINFLA